MINLEKEHKKFKVIDGFNVIYHSYDEYEKAQKLRNALSKYHNGAFFIVEQFIRPIAPLTPHTD